MMTNSRKWWTSQILKIGIFWVSALMMSGCLLLKDPDVIPDEEATKTVSRSLQTYVDAQGAVESLLVYDGYLYAGIEDYYRSLEVLDLMELTSGTTFDGSVSLEDAGPIYSMVEVNGYLAVYAAEYGLALYDISSNPLVPVERSAYMAAYSSVCRMAAVDNILYAATDYGDVDLYEVNGTLQYLGTLELSIETPVAISNDNDLLVVGTYDDMGDTSTLWTFDVSSPAAPVYEGQTLLEGELTAMQLFHQALYAAVTTETTEDYSLVSESKITALEWNGTDEWADMGRTYRLFSQAREMNVDRSRNKLYVSMEDEYYTDERLLRVYTMGSNSASLSNGIDVSLGDSYRDLCLNPDDADPNFYVSTPSLYSAEVNVYQRL